MLNRDQKRSSIFILFLATLSITLAFGLIPRGNFTKNWVSHNPHGSGVYFGEYGYAIGSLPEFDRIKLLNNSSEIAQSNDAYVKNLSSEPANLSIALSINAREQEGSLFRVIIYIGDSCENNPLMLGQWKTHLIFLQGCEFTGKGKKARLSTDLKNNIGSTTLVKIDLSSPESQLIVNKELVDSENAVQFVTPSSLDTKILIGNTPNGSQGWTGTILDLNISQIVKTPASNELLRNFQFINYDGMTKIDDTSAAHQALTIPKPGQFLEREVLKMESFKSLLKNLKFDTLVNIIGFIPLGFVSALLLSIAFKCRLLVLLPTTVVIACTVSLGIELSQVLIAGRKSSLHDFILNGLGGFIGLLLFTVAQSLSSTPPAKDE